MIPEPSNNSEETLNYMQIQLGLSYSYNYNSTLEDLYRIAETLDVDVKDLIVSTKP
jgi:hypothetical protein